MEVFFWKIYLCCLLTAAGAVLGSFLDCAARRWARGENFIKGRSRCEACGHELGARDLIPVFSWLAAKGKCRYCKAAIPAECLFAELAGGGVFLLLGIRYGIQAQLGEWLVLCTLLLAVSLTDLAKRLIPDKLLLAMVLNRIIWFFVLQEALGEAVKTALISFCAVPVPLFFLVLIMDKLLGKESMGGGDIKLIAVMALYMSWSELLLTIIAACILGILGVLAARNRQPIPFGPYLGTAFLLVNSFGSPLIQWYMGMLK